MLLNKKLTIAVLTLGFLLTLASAAFTSETIKVRTDDYPIPYKTINPDNPRYQLLSLKIANRPVHSFSRPDITHAITPATVLPPDYMCDALLYPDDDSWAAYTTIPYDPYLMTTIVMRMTPEAGYVCTLKTVSVLVYGPGMVGTPDAYMMII